MIDYLDKYRGKFGRNSVYDILSLDPNIPKDWEIIKREYLAVDIDKVKIDGDTFTNYGDFQFVWEKSYVKEPKRSANGVIGNLNSYATFITPHLIMNFSIMSIDDYRAIMRKDLERNEFVVECYDPIYNVRIKKKMYFGTPEMAKLFTIAKVRFNGDDWEEFIELVGVREYSVELIGTNADLDLVSVRYIVNPPQVTENGVTTTLVPDFATDGGEEDVYSGEDLVIGGNTDIPNETFGGRYKFTKWNISSANPTEPKEKGNYLNGYAYTINANLVLYAQWEAVTEHTLTFNYGLSDPAINESAYSYKTSRKVVKGKEIGTLPIAEIPRVKYKDLNGVEQEYTMVYYNPQWWKVPRKVKKLDENGNNITDTLIVKNNELYWSDRDSTIYLLYDVSTYSLELYIKGNLYSTNIIEYGTPMNLPIPVQSGERFEGWYTTSDYKEGTKISGNMPPYNLTLYARMIKE